MKRIVTYEFTKDEKFRMDELNRATERLHLAKRHWEAEIKACVKEGLPVRVIGEFAGCSGAHVSRLSRKERDALEGSKR